MYPSISQYEYVKTNRQISLTIWPQSDSNKDQFPYLQISKYITNYKI